MGLLRESEWTGPWIRHPQAPAVAHIWFRKNLVLDEKLSSAFIHVASVGYHELYVNGNKVDDRLLGPVLTRLDKRVLYLTYDLTDLLKTGDNTIALWQGPGWARYAFFKTMPALRVQFNAQKNNYCNGTQVQLAFALLTGITPAISHSSSNRCPAAT